MKTDIPSHSQDPEWTSEELEFMLAMQRYKERNHRRYPTWSEVLQVLKSLGYRKTEETK